MRWINMIVIGIIIFNFFRQRHCSGQFSLLQQEIQQQMYFNILRVVLTAYFIKHVELCFVY